MHNKYAKKTQVKMHIQYVYSMFVTLLVIGGHTLIPPDDKQNKCMSLR